MWAASDRLSHPLQKIVPYFPRTLLGRQPSLEAVDRYVKILDGRRDSELVRKFTNEQRLIGRLFAAEHVVEVGNAQGQVEFHC